ncbi:MAG: Glu/Leu/Phe/Val dehydrogenase family protein, partial [Bdellovibrionota bacterium]
VYHGIRASVQRGLGGKSLSGVRIAIQGLGGVASSLLKHIISEGAVVLACDVNSQAVDRVREQYGDLVEIVSPGRITDVTCDVFAPCALGGVITQEVADKLRAKIVAGAANNQLVDTAAGVTLGKRHILYAPDYVINAGGVINIYHESLPEGYDRSRAYIQIRKISETLETIYERSFVQGMPTAVVADELARSRLANGR